MRRLYSLAGRPPANPRRTARQRYDGQPSQPPVRQTLFHCRRARVLHATAFSKMRVSRVAFFLRCASCALFSSKTRDFGPSPSTFVPGATRPLTRSPLHPIHGVSVGRTAAAREAEESPGSMDMRCRITSGGGDPRDSATENKPPRFSPTNPLPRLRGRVGEGGAVRVKRCGKSAPRWRQRWRHGKPHREQNRIGTAWSACRCASGGGVSGSMSGSGRPGRLLEAPGNRRSRGMAVTRRFRNQRHTERGLQAG